MEPLRYDLVFDFERWLVAQGLITRAQYDEAYAGHARGLEEGRFVPVADLLVSQGATSHEALKKALSTLRLIDGPADAESPKPNSSR